MVESNRVRSLFEKARRGDRQAFDELVRVIEPRLRSSLARPAGRTAAVSDLDDVVQETLVLAYETIGRFEWRNEASFFGWLSRISRNVAIDHAKDVRRRRYLQLPETLPGSGASPSRLMRQDERLEQLERAIASLPPDYRAVLRHSQLERLKLEEIARRMGRSVYSVKHLLARALHTLRESLRDTGSFSLPDRPLEVEGGDDGER
jgi:RNA polymerase sigma-70 factor (ECF subfamily)